ncbi:MAG: hypothetical protein NTX68_18175 [Rhodococcus sp.]|nr:hypothetical protein [Rhodococcus sp. (in: high G+C Gram-positive bacteria)]MCX6492885.1 hypothetical protein [Rhodococcus sp. (in: high G+C Gram-positive bacteria)]
MNELDATATHFVEAAVTLLVADPRRILDRGMRIEDVVHASDSSTATFFRKFSTKADFLDKVVEQLARTSLPTDVHETVRSQVTNGGASIRSTVTALVAQYFPAIVDRQSITTKPYWARSRHCSTPTAGPFAVPSQPERSQ